MKALNARLYQLLKTRFGDVRVSNRGLPGTIRRSTIGKKTFVDAHGGEYYRVNCPACGDTRQRLWVSYLYGTTCSDNDRPMYHLAKCYNCDGTGWSISQLRELSPSFSKALFQVTAAAGEDFSANPPAAVMPPGKYVALPELSKEHPVAAYLMGRGYDLAEIHTRFGWRYCDSSPEYYVARRLFIPVFHRTSEKLIFVGYQTRAVPGLSLAERPKYWTMPGFQRSRVLYNLHNARKYGRVVLVEGVTDAARVGPNAIALLGKTLSATQSWLINKHCSHADVAILLDSDAQKSAHGIHWTLSNTGCFEGHRVKGVFNVALAAGDPGDYTREQLDTLIAEAGEKRSALGVVCYAGAAGR